MKIFGFPVPFTKQVEAVTETEVNSLVASGGGGGWFNVVRETAAGAWQSMLAPAHNPREVLSFSAVFACITAIASDIAKLRVMLVEETDEDVCIEIDVDDYPVLQKPNRYQNWIQFISCWIVSKLVYGNAYTFKEREKAGGRVVAVYVLDPRRVQVIVPDSDNIYYELSPDKLSGILEKIYVPASEIIHDVMTQVFGHPLCGVSPLFAAGCSALQGKYIQSGSTKFFENMSRPSGVLTYEGKLDSEDAAKIKDEWNANYSGQNIGRVALINAKLKYEPIASVPPQEAQMLQQLEWTIADVARCYHVPLFKIGGPIPSGSTLEQLNQTYYNDCLQILIESFEATLGEGIGLKKGQYIQLDLNGLVRMDGVAQATFLKTMVSGTIMAPNEARKTMNLPKKPGGDSLFIQQQNYSTEAIAKRDGKEDPFARQQTRSTDAAPPPPPLSSDDGEDNDVNALTDYIVENLKWAA